MVINKFPVAISSIIILFAITESVQAIEYKITDLGTFGGDFSYAFAITDNGYITGTFGTYGPNGTLPATNNAYLLDRNNNSVVDIGALNGVNSFGFDVNTSGQVTGSHDGGAFLYDGVGGFQDLGSLSGIGARGEGINSSGHIVGPEFDAITGFYYDGTTMIDFSALIGGGVGHDINDLGHVTGYNANGAFIYDGTNLQSIGAGVGGVGYAINENDHVTGRGVFNNELRAFLYDGVNTLNLSTLGGSFSEGLDMNDHDQIVGMSHDGSAQRTAFLYDQGKMLDICVLTDCISNGWSSLTYADGINNHGEIVGFGWINGEEHAFLASPIPVPAAVWLFGSGLIGLIGLARRKKA